MNPVCAGVSRARGLREELVTFRDCYRAALELYRAGVENVVFPAGTYWMRAFHRQKCEPMLSGAVPAAP